MMAHKVGLTTSIKTHLINRHFLRLSGQSPLKDRWLNVRLVGKMIQEVAPIRRPHRLGLLAFLLGVFSRLAEVLFFFSSVFVSLEPVLNFLPLVSIDFILLFGFVFILLENQGFRLLTLLALAFWLFKFFLFLLKFNLDLGQLLFILIDIRILREASGHVLQIVKYFGSFIVRVEPSTGFASHRARPFYEGFGAFDLLELDGVENNLEDIVRLGAVHVAVTLVPEPIHAHVRAHFRGIIKQMRRSSEVLLSVGVHAFVPVVLLVEARTNFGLESIQQKLVFVHVFLLLLQVDEPQILVVNQLIYGLVLMRIALQRVQLLFKLILQLNLAQVSQFE